MKYFFLADYIVLTKIGCTAWYKLGSQTTGFLCKNIDKIRDFHPHGYSGSSIPSSPPETFPSLAMSGRALWCVPRHLFWDLWARLRVPTPDHSGGRRQFDPWRLSIFRPPTRLTRHFELRGTPRTCRWRGIDSQTQYCTISVMGIAVSYFNHWPNASEGAKAVPSLVYISI